MSYRELRATNVPCVQCSEPLRRQYIITITGTGERIESAGHYECDGLCVGNVTPDGY